MAVSIKELDEYEHDYSSIYKDDDKPLINDREEMF